MLSFFRENRAIIWVIGGLAMAGLVLSMVGTGVNLGSFGSGLSYGTAAVVGDESITVQELLTQIGRQRDQMSASMEQYLGPEASKNRDFVNQLLRAQLRPDRVLNELVNRKLFIMTAEQNGAVATPLALRNNLAQIAAFQKDGVFDVLTYKEVLKANNLSPGLFEQDIKDQVKAEWFRDVFLSSLASVSESEKAALDQVSKIYTWETLVVDAATFASPKSVSETEVQEFIAKPDSKQKIEAYYNSNISKYEKPEEIRAKHILIKGDQAEAKIKDLRAKISSKSLSFDEAAKKHSEDISNASKGGDLGYFAKGVMDPAFEAAAFSLTNDNRLSEPVKSAFGWHLIELVDRKKEQKTSLDAAKTEIAKTLSLTEARQSSARAWMQSFIDKGVPPTESEAKAIGLKWETQKGWSPMDPRLGELGSMESHLSDLLALNSANPFLKKAIPVGERLVLLKLKSVEAPAKDPKASVAVDKAGEAFGFYLEEVRKTLENSKEIKISQDALKLVEAELQRSGF